MHIKTHIIIASFLCPAPGIVLSQEVSDICKSAPTIFKDSTIVSKQSYKDSYRKMICAASWESYQDVVNAGIDTTIPIYDIQLPLDINYDHSKQKQWQSANCSAEERQADFSAEGYILAKEISPASASAWLGCIRATQKNAVPRALSCRIVETDAATLFEAKWRLVEGMKEAEAPTILGLDVINTTCGDTSALKKGRKLNSGGAAVLCSGNTDKAPMFVLNTDRGSCAANGLLASAVTQLSGKIELKSPTVYRGENLKLAGDLNIITNGYNLVIDAKRMILEGSPKLMAFNTPQPLVDRRGDSAGEIQIRAQKVEGTILLIENFGQDGGAGSAGPKGDKGQKGGPGARRHHRGLEGCVGGHAGGTGGTGSPGRPGQAGATGGNGGDVVLDIDQGLFNGAISRIKVATSRVDRKNNPYECGGTCSGLGGVGGPGGPGGDGGDGGDGAGGDWPCGGHPGGEQGREGPKGPDGPEGHLGTPGRISVL